MSEQHLKLYAELAQWWPMVSPPWHYVEEAADLLPSLLEGLDLSGATPRASRPTLLELGCGGGSLVSHFKPHFTLTLTDRSPGMLEQCRRVNPECELILGDMRTIDLGRVFDRVLVHDAIMYAITPEAVRATLRTAARHCRAGGTVLIVPDCTTETFEPSTDLHGEDGEDGRGVRYLEWTWDPDPTDHTFETAYAFVLREADGQVTFEGDRHVEGVFPQADWLAWCEEAGLRTRARRDPWKRDVFIGIKRG